MRQQRQGKEGLATLGRRVCTLPDCAFVPRLFRPERQSDVTTAQEPTPPRTLPSPVVSSRLFSSAGSNSDAHGEDRHERLVAYPDSRTGSRDGQTSPTAVFNPYYTGRPRSPNATLKHEPINRQEIIRRIKSRENGSRPGSPEMERPPSSSGWARREPAPLPPSCRLDTGAADIERGRSGQPGCREKEEKGSGFGRFAEVARDEQQPALATSPVAPWHAGFPAAAFRQAWLERRQPPPPQSRLDAQRPVRSRAVSNATLASSFTYKPPTSPLVHQSRPDTPDPPSRPLSPTVDKSRRHTFSPEALKRFSSAALDYPASARGQASRPVPTLRKETTYPYQAHQPRRSVHSFNSLPQVPSPGPRRPSISESPIQHAHMVGSYEESILRGRMSTTPSKPLNFVAQIGVLGKGQCSSKLRCPPHAHIPFPAVFYSYGSGTKQGWQSDQPSPYVGLVDLENNLPSAEPTTDKRKQRLEDRLQTSTNSDEGSRASSRNRGEEGSAPETHAKRRLRQKQKRRSGSPKAPPGGSYRIPQQGQLQIVIKNPNKTAVKLFLVPYDLSDMEPGQKTFIRQRSYSAGPIVDMPLSSRNNLGTDRPEAALPTSDDPNERPTLRYLLHLHICSPSKGRFFLYKSIRVVFANRVPDGKERLRNEIQLPEPRYSVYKPSRDSNMGIANTPEFASRRRSGLMDSAHHSPSDLDPPPSWPASQSHDSSTRPIAHSLPSTQYADGNHTISPFTFAHDPDPMDVDVSPFQRAKTPLHPVSPSPGSRAVQVGEMQDDPFTFRRDRGWETGLRGSGSGSAGGEARNESLLSRRLKGLEFRGR
ncbi:hypothetical protein Q7P37_000130 [Cladosporium fusiforme]